MTDRPTTLERVYPPKIMFLLANPALRWMLGSKVGRRLEGLVRLDFTGRRTGTAYRVVAATHEIDGRLAVLTNSAWKHNFHGGHPVDAMFAGEAEASIGTLEESPDVVASVYARRIEELGIDAAPRKLGIRITGDAMPTIEELETFASEVGLAVIWLDPLIEGA